MKTKIVAAAALSLCGFLTFGASAESIEFNHESQVAAACVSNYGVTYAAAGCIAEQLTTDELEKCLQEGVGGDGCFGDSNTLVSLVRANLEAAQRENGDLNQGIRAITGISVRDIEENGILGGSNSFFHCPFGGC